ncbi:MULTISPECIES: iron ABC transporter permease [unclassified Paenibacillus]|uniref:FecCD family ABC transporter permease n=1 Tax=unclassified Paenibacillus TaxID=185978 RepID=UPI00104CDC38|nr:MULTISPECIES: iron ABC transporter permease [unclassified Paenibacillus]NIK71242.1 iron complex transport system permease protein [Paenibacillus sp. BK720]TCM97038.1 iron complex transport system permease protein [Paenibacillus sp. BK033]
MILSHMVRKQRIILGILLLLIVATVIVSLSLGYSTLTFKRLIPVIFGDGTKKENFILFDIRMPRVIITLLAGMALALSGSILQGVSRNDLADPGIVGINSGAGVAITVFFLFFPTEAGPFVYALPVVAFIGGLATAVLIALFSWKKHVGIQPVSMVLTGIGFQMALSGVMIVLISSADRQKVDFIAKWIAGGIWGTDWVFINAMWPWLAIFIPFTLYKANRLNILALNEPVAVGVGISLTKERLVLLFSAVALAASAVSVTGGIAFIGLLAPHIAKALVGPRNQLFIPISILFGGWLLVLADTIGRQIDIAGGLPAGIVVSLIGAPYFLFLLLKK